MDRAANAPPRRTLNKENISKKYQDRIESAVWIEQWVQLTVPLSGNLMANLHIRALRRNLLFSVLGLY
jgi:hypothetical protein